MTAEIRQHGKRMSLEFDPPVTAENISRMPVTDKQKIVDFIALLLGHRPTKEEIINFLNCLGLKER